MSRQQNLESLRRLPQPIVIQQTYITDRRPACLGNNLAGVVGWFRRTSYTGNKVLTFCTKFHNTRLQCNLPAIHWTRWKSAFQPPGSREFTTRPDAFGEQTRVFGGKICPWRREVVQILASLVAFRGNTDRHFGFVGKIGLSLLSSDCRRNLSPSLRPTSGINCGKSRKHKLPSSKTSTGSS